MAIRFQVVFCAYSAGPERGPGLLAAQRVLPLARACGCCLWGFGMVFGLSPVFFLLSLVVAF
ncbi:hypothetical protein ADM96_03920 [Burkholderia sp. ST111]|nr:hypothetical protein ADM96_03920 [Burkholderia sp. ST111]